MKINVQRLSRSLSEIDSVSWLGLVQHVRSWQIGRVALLSAHFAALDLPHDLFAILGHLSPTDSTPSGPSHIAPIKYDQRQSPGVGRLAYQEPTTWNDTGAKWGWRDKMGKAHPATLSSPLMKANHAIARGLAARPTKNPPSGMTRAPSGGGGIKWA